MKVEVGVRGMHCAGCVKTIEDTARGVAGVDDARVNFASEQASLDVDPDKFRAAALQQALLDRGYRVVPRRVVYRVEGLDPSGISALEARLRALPGVLDRLHAARAMHPADPDLHLHSHILGTRARKRTVRFVV